MRELPDWYPGTAETKPAPMPLLLVQAFVNTRDLEDATDVFDVPATARQWLIDAGLLDGASELTESDLARARAVREAIRALIEADGPAADGRLEPLRQLAASHRARLALAEDGALGLENSRRGGLDDGLFELLLIVHRAQQDGTWSRLKICANDACQWAFFDRSRNQQGNWCNMAVCGNRLKNRELRARRR
ncbi:MAG TPA: CGNR zinc finger domain-containing protein [Solirubrobacteraceae bacterium]|nr:CGNR zinc finger domain-containing protein [Solirubrobacteraceae bacterium]